MNFHRHFIQDKIHCKKNSLPCHRSWWSVALHDIRSTNGTGKAEEKMACCV